MSGGALNGVLSYSLGRVRASFPRVRVGTGPLSPPSRAFYMRATAAAIVITVLSACSSGETTRGGNAPLAEPTLESLNLALSGYVLTLEAGARHCRTLNCEINNIRDFAPGAPLCRRGVKPMGTACVIGCQMPVFTWGAMDQNQKLNLKDLLPAWEAELPNAVSDTVLDRALRGEIGVPAPASGKYLLGDGSAPIAQDAVNASLISQRGIKESF